MTDNVEISEYKYINNIRKKLIEQLQKIDAKNIDMELLDKTVNSEVEFIRKSFIANLLSNEVKAIDAFGQEFILNKAVKVTEYFNVDEIIQLKMDNPLIPLENIFLISNIRFSVAYDENNEPSLINIPSDIYKFLIKNNYDQSMFDMLVDKSIYIEYNYAEIFKAMLTVGKNYAEKCQLLGSDSSDKVLIRLIKSKIATYSIDEVEDIAFDKLGGTNYRKLVKKCHRLKINKNDVMYRIAIKDMPVKDAIELGMEEKEKYGIDYEYNTMSIYSVRRVFFAIAREYMKENNL